MLQGKNIIIGISGSIAAYKTITLVRLLIKEGAYVKVVMTPAAKEFASPLVLSTLSKNPVLIDLSTENSWANHVELGRWAHLMVIAPLSCNTLAKLAHGFCDNLLMAVYLSAVCPVVVAPAMDEDMWKHNTTKENLAKLISVANKIIPVDNGELASGLIGEGRMAEPEAILKFITDHFNEVENSKDFTDKKILITAGPTYESIDPVRFIGNHSTGKMGIALAEEFTNRGASVTLVIGPTDQSIASTISKKISVTSAAEMYNACINEFPLSDIAIMSAAVADYTPIRISDQKIKKSESTFTIELQKTKDILEHLGSVKSANQFVVGFALETNNERQYALEKLTSKKADLIVMNSLNNEGAGFGVDTNKVTLFHTSGKEFDFALKSKKEVAKDIADVIKSYLHA